MNGAPRGTQHSDAAPPHGDTHSTSSSMRANTLQQLQVGATAPAGPTAADTITQNPEGSAVAQSVSHAIPASQPLSLTCHNANTLQQNSPSTSFPVLQSSILQQPCGWNPVDLQPVLYAPPAIRFARALNQAPPLGSSDLASPHPLLSGSPSTAVPSPLPSIAVSSGSFINVPAASSQAPSSSLQMLNAAANSSFLAQYQLLLSAAVQQQQQQATQSMASASSQQTSSSASQIGLSSPTSSTYDQVHRYFLHLQQQQLSNQLLAQSALRSSVNSMTQVRTALGATVNPFSQNVTSITAPNVSQQRLPVRVPTPRRAITPLSPTPGPSGLQTGKVPSDVSGLIPSVFTSNLLGVSPAKVADLSGPLSAASSDEPSTSKTGGRSRQNASHGGSLMLPPPLPRSRNLSIASPSAGQQRQRPSPSPYQRPPHFASESLPVHSYHPSHFMKGTVIQLQSGKLKRVEDMSTDDFVDSAAMNSDLILCYSKVRSIQNAGKERHVIVTFTVEQQKAEVSIEAGIEHPYFVVRHGWASCSPEKTRSSYGLTCKQLQVGDVCIAVYDGGKEEASLSNKPSGTEASVLTKSGNSSVDGRSEQKAPGELDDKVVQEDSDSKCWRSSATQPPSSGNSSQLASDVISQVSMHPRSESSN